MTSAFVLHVITTGCLFFFIWLLMYNSYVYAHTLLSKVYTQHSYIFSSFCVYLYRFFFLSSSVQTIIIYPSLLLLLHSRFVSLSLSHLIIF
jgi:hypothetical protein